MNARMVILGLIFAAAQGAVQGAAVRRINLETLIARSERVVHGRVIGMHAFWDADTRTIWTATELQVLDTVKGPSGRSVIVTEPGGVVGNVGHLVPGVPQFRVDDEVLVFLHSGPGNRLRVTGMHQGVYAVTKDASTGQSIARPLASRQAEFVYEQAARPAVEQRTTGTYRLTDLLHEIRQRVR